MNAKSEGLLISKILSKKKNKKNVLIFLQELEKKFNNTAAYHNMKKIITKKNDQIKELRNRLSKYESLDNLETVSVDDNEAANKNDE